ncbi:cyclophilin-like fold protein [Promicromonospora sukumoe]|uniref:cyclophilin-like fold protein n=1 Tax=Promicromonospora sukumoe TaxID=88382 RepID=UPI0036461BC0
MTNPVGTVIRFRNKHTSIDVRVDQDNPTIRSLISQLPLHELMFVDNNGLEKLARLPETLDVAGSPPSGIRPGDLICFTPWNSIAFWYDPAGYPPREELVHLGRFNATTSQLEQIADAPVVAHLP